MDKNKIIDQLEDDLELAKRMRQEDNKAWFIERKALQEAIEWLFTAEHIDRETYVTAMDKAGLACFEPVNALKEVEG